MVNDLKNILLAGLGSAAYTYEKAEKFVGDMVKKGKLTLDEGKELSEELKRNMINKADDLKPLTKEDIKELLDKISNLEKRIEALEKKEI